MAERRVGSRGGYTASILKPGLGADKLEGMAKKRGKGQQPRAFADFPSVANLSVGDGDDRKVVDSPSPAGPRVAKEVSRRSLQDLRVEGGKWQRKLRYAGCA